MSARPALDVATLPTFGFGHRSILWWSTMGLVLIEGAAFALLGVSYLYLKWREPLWPPGLEPPDLIWGTANLVLLLVSAIPNQLTKRAAERLDRGKVKLWLSVCMLLTVGFFAIRVLEFATLNCWWDTNAYGSIVWMLLGMHTAHILTDVIDTGVLTAIVFVGPVDGPRFVDVSENALYWYFVVLSWVPIYGLIYLAPRIL
ncbi:MAG TPA: cytochrome c oxidase subunit 3 [Vicinamibacterales bacterium]|nr:cytochrome c oxidase subunit 3 [Vicinamibacterales bacterium]